MKKISTVLLITLAIIDLDLTGNNGIKLHRHKRITMSAKLIILVTVAMVSLTACSVETPMGGKLDNGETISGFSTEGPSGGAIALEFQGGGSCNGEFDTTTDDTELFIPITCDNGKTGTVSITRKKDIAIVWGTIELSDGRKGTLDFSTGPE